MKRPQNFRRVVGAPGAQAERCRSPLGPHHALHQIRWHAVINKSGGVGVPQVVKPQTAVLGSGDLCDGLSLRAVGALLAPACRAGPRREPLLVELDNRPEQTGTDEARPRRSDRPSRKDVAPELGITCWRRAQPPSRVRTTLSWSSGLSLTSGRAVVEGDQAGHPVVGVRCVGQVAGTGVGVHLCRGNQPCQFGDDGGEQWWASRALAE